MTLTTLGSVIGGVGLFLLGMRLMTEGLRLAAGPSLRVVLEKSTSTALKGILSGALITALVQSSSAITVATIGFVNAGLFNLSQAIYVIYGTNIGTTVTGWLVALIGFNVNIKAFALPAIGIGMALRIMRGHSRLGMLGEALAGFGVFFLGIEVLKTTFSGLGEGIDVLQFDASVWRVFLLTGAGFLLTFLMQSSSAALTIILTSAGGGILPLNAAAAMVIGANIGTTSTAALAVIGATPNAKRVASAHLAFNLITGVVALLLLPLLLYLLGTARTALGLDSEPAAVLALFHTVFNILGVLLLWPLTKYLVAFLERRFRSEEELESKPRFLDNMVAETPTLGLNSIILELDRVADLSLRMAESVISQEHETPEQLEAEHAAVESLNDAIGNFIARLQRTSLTEELANCLPDALRVSGYLNEIADISLALENARKTLEPIREDEISAQIAAHRSKVSTLLHALRKNFLNVDTEQLAAQISDLTQSYRDIKTRLLRLGTEGAVSIRQLVAYTDYLTLLRRLSERAGKAARHLHTAPDLQTVIKEITVSQARPELPAVQPEAPKTSIGAPH